MMLKESGFCSVHLDVYLGEELLDPGEGISVHGLDPAEVEQK
jgi:hypothetical protein